MKMNQPRAVVLIGDEVKDVRGAIASGLAALKFRHDNSVDARKKPASRDLLITWQRYYDRHETALRFEAAGAPVIIMENGYVGAQDNERGKPVDSKGEKLYALALNMHNGAGRWPIGAPGRWRDQGIRVKPWREGGEKVVLLAQRGIGIPPVASPRDWHVQMERRLKKITERPVEIRGHPGPHAARVPLESQLKSAWCAITWASSAGIRAICMGVPVFSEFKQWIAAPCVRQDLSDLEHPICDDVSRETMLDSLAWAQWTLPEIATGTPFQLLLDLHRQEAQAA